MKMKDSDKIENEIYIIVKQYSKACKKDNIPEEEIEERLLEIIEAAGIKIGG